MSVRTKLWHLPILAGIVALVVAVPGTALAKGPTDAHVEGPGLAQPLTLGWDKDEASLLSLIDATGFWQLAEPAAATAPSGEFGARYVITFTVHDDQGEPAVLALHAYPFADPAPRVYAPSGQVWPMGAVPEGWRTATSALTAWFDAEAGGPAPQAAAAETADAAAVAPTQSSSGTPWLPLAVVGGAVVAVAALVGAGLAIRRRETAAVH